MHISISILSFNNRNPQFKLSTCLLGEHGTVMGVGGYLSSLLCNYLSVTLWKILINGIRRNYVNKFQEVSQGQEQANSSHFPPPCLKHRCGGRRYDLEQENKDHSLGIILWNFLSSLSPTQSATEALRHSWTLNPNFHLNLCYFGSLLHIANLSSCLFLNYLLTSKENLRKKREKQWNVFWGIYALRSKP